MWNVLLFLHFSETAYLILRESIIVGQFLFATEQHFWDYVFLRGHEKKIGNICWHDIERPFHFAFSFPFWTKVKRPLKDKNVSFGCPPLNENHLFHNLRQHVLQIRTWVTESCLLFWTWEMLACSLCKLRVCHESTEWFYPYILLISYQFLKGITCPLSPFHLKLQHLFWMLFLACGLSHSQAELHQRVTIFVSLTPESLWKHQDMFMTGS